MKPGSLYKDVSPGGRGEVILIFSANTKFVLYLRATGQIRSIDRPWFDHCVNKNTVVLFGTDKEIE